MRKAVFLDRDGTMIEDVGYLNSPAQIRFIPGSIEAVKLLNKAGYEVIVITNQAGVARGLVTEDMLQTIEKTMHKKILNGGAYITGSYYCPHHPEHGVYPYRQACECRKPHPGLIKKAAKQHDLDLSQSFMIGDKALDITAGKRAGAKSILLLTGMGKEEQARLEEKPAHTASDLLAAVKWILNEKA